MSNLRKWTVDEAVSFKQGVARFGQAVEVQVRMPDEFLNEFTGDLYSKFKIGNSCSNIHYLNQHYGTALYNSSNEFTGQYSVSFSIVAGEPAKKFKASVREVIAEAIGYLDALPVDDGSCGKPTESSSTEDKEWRWIRIDDLMTSGDKKIKVIKAMRNTTGQIAGFMPSLIHTKNTVENKKVWQVSKECADRLSEELTSLAVKFTISGSGICA